MRTRIISLGFIAWMLSLLAQSPVSARTPWHAMLGMKRVEADATKRYYLTETNGPWCILAASFAGEGAEEEAHRLVIELRQRYGLEAYLHKQRYDFTQPVSGLGVDKYGAPKKMRYLHGGAYDEVAVLIGNFPALDDIEVEKTLDRVKYAKPEALSLNGRQHSTQRFAGLRAVQRLIVKDEEKRTKGPMGSAFVTRNPILPAEYFTGGAVDKMVVDMNSGVPNCLLDCPGKYTVRIATFRGNVVLDQKQINDIERGKGMASQLDKAAENAHRLTEALRAKGIEAYEFHDRHESIVTIGSFDSVGTPRSDGKTEINPAVHRLMTEYGAKQQALPGAPPGMKPQRLAGVDLDIQPMPVAVPKRSIASDYISGLR